MKKFSALEWIYFLVALVEIGSEVTSNEAVRFYSKPLLMPVLLIWFIMQVARPFHAVKWLFAVSLVFAWVGDVALMFVPKSATDIELMGIAKNPVYFLLGLGGFLLTHLLYIYTFFDLPSSKSPGPLQKNPFSIVTITLVSYFMGLVFLVFPSIPSEMLLPVSVYSATIAAMVFTSYNRKGRVSVESFNLVFAGALLFLVSDSLIAISSFRLPGMNAGLCIMLLYISAQYLITKGMLKRWEE